MKTFQHNPGKLLMLAIAGSLLASATTQAGAFDPRSAPLNAAAFTGNARLIVWRAADFGSLIYLNLLIDGIPITTLGRNEGYEAIMRPGQHVFSIGTTPCPYGHTRFFHRRVNVKRGETYAFTAMWVGADRAVLETSDPSNLASQLLW